MIPTDDTTKRIQELNDQLRRTGKGGRVLFTRGVRDPGLLDQALAAVRTFDAFTPDNDPHEEHDFGSFTLDGRKLFWKIDLYDRSNRPRLRIPARAGGFGARSDDHARRRILTEAEAAPQMARPFGCFPKGSSRIRQISSRFPVTRRDASR